MTTNTTNDEEIQKGICLGPCSLHRSPTQRRSLFGRSRYLADGSTIQEFWIGHYQLDQMHKPVECPSSNIQLKVPVLPEASKLPLDNVKPEAAVTSPEISIKPGTQIKIVLDKFWTSAGMNVVLWGSAPTETLLQLYVQRTLYCLLVEVCWSYVSKTGLSLLCTIRCKVLRDSQSRAIQGNGAAACLKSSSTGRGIEVSTRKREAIGQLSGWPPPADSSFSTDRPKWSRHV